MACAATGQWHCTLAGGAGPGAGERMKGDGDGRMCAVWGERGRRELVGVVLCTRTRDAACAMWTCSMAMEYRHTARY